MKQILLLFCLLTTCFYVNAEQPTNTKLKFNTLDHNFGNQPQGKPVSFEFEFTNTSNEPIVLENVQASCGCTTPIWTKEPVLPGKKGTIKAQYNMAREGSFRKSITVSVKDSENIVLYVSGNAIEQKPGVDAAEGTMLDNK